MVRRPLRLSVLSIVEMLPLPVSLLVLWQVLLSAQNPGLMSDDSGEMIAASYTLGLPHPPGYPLYCLLGKVFSWVPVGTVAFRYNLLAALVGLLALCLVLDTCRLLLDKVPSLATGVRFWDWALPWFAATGLFFNRGFFGQCLTAKGLVYLLALLMICFLVWTRVRRGTEGRPLGPGLGLYPVLFLFVLGFAHHWQTQILLLPFLLFWHFQEKNPWSLKNTFVAASLGSIALSLYLYLPLRSALGALPDWGEPHTLSQALWVLGRKLAVAGPAGEGLLREGDHYLTWGGEYLRTMADHWWPGLWSVILLGAIRLAWVRRDLFVGLVALYGTVLAGLLTVPREETLFLLPVYLVTLHGVAALLGCLGTAFLLGTLSDWKGYLATVLGLFLLGTLAFHGRGVFRSEDKSRYTLAQDLGTNALRDLPRNALFLSEGDHMLMPIWYAQFVEGKRPDLLFQPAPFLLHGWGWRQLEDREPSFGGIGRIKTFQERLGSLVLGPRPLFYSQDSSYLGEGIAKLPGSWSPAGLVLRWRRGPVGAREVSREVLASEAGWRLRGIRDYLSSPGRDVSSEEVLHYYAQPHYLASHRLYQEGHLWPAVKHLAWGIEYQPKAAAYGNLAALLGKMGEGPLAEKYAELARRAREGEGAGTPK